MSNNHLKGTLNALSSYQTVVRCWRYYKSLASVSSTADIVRERYMAGLDEGAHKPWRRDIGMHASNVLF